MTMTNTANAPFQQLSNKEALLRDWKHANDILTQAKTAEADLRKQIIAAYSDKADDYSGVENHDIGFGYDLKIEHKLNYTLKSADSFKDVHAVINRIESISDVAAFIAGNLFKQKFEISVSEYKKLPVDIKQLVDTVLTIAPASKSVKIAERKK